jgi:hypothetical protein
MTKLKMSPPRPQPKHFHVSRAGVTVNEGVFSLWNGHRPLNDAPALRRLTLSPISSARSIFCLISAATPTDVIDLPLGARLLLGRVGARFRHGDPPTPDTRVALSSLDKAPKRDFTPWQGA